MRQRWRTFFGTDAPGSRKRKQNARGNAVLGLLGGFLLAYMLSEALLAAFMHPIHWTAAAIAAIALYIGSYLWLLRRSYVRQQYGRSHR